MRFGHIGEYKDFEIKLATQRDIENRRRRANLREMWRTSDDPRKAAAVRLAQAVYGANDIAMYAGISYRDALILATGEDLHS